MASAPYMPMYPADFLSDENAIALSIHAFGAWTKTLLIMWRAESATLTKSLAQWDRAWGLHGAADPAEVMAELSTVGSVVDNNDGSWAITSRRIGLEIEKMAGKRDAARKRKAEWSSKHEPEEGTHSERVPNAFPTRSDMTSDFCIERKEKGDARGEGFDAAWDAYGHKVARKNAERAWARLSAAQRTAALAAIPAYVKRTDPAGAGGLTIRAHFATWLNAERWNDEAAATNGAALNGHAVKRSCTACGGDLGLDASAYQGRPYCGPCYDRAAWRTSHKLVAA